MLFHPWRDEDAELNNINQEEAFARHQESIEEKRAKFVSNCDSAVRDALQQDAAGQDQDEDVLDGIVPIADLDAEKVDEAEQGGFQALEDHQNRRVDAMEQIGQPARTDEVERFLAPGRIEEGEFEQLLSSLNATQSKYLLHLIHSFKTDNLPVYEFLSGGAGVGKSRLIKVIFQGLIRYFGSIPGANPDDLTVRLADSLFGSVIQVDDALVLVGRSDGQVVEPVEVDVAGGRKGEPEARVRLAVEDRRWLRRDRLRRTVLKVDVDGASLKSAERRTEI